MKFLERKNIGNIAKQFVGDLFTESGFDVYPMGYESEFSTIKNKIRNNEDDVSRRIRTIPDLLVIDNKKMTPSLIEVKYRSYSTKMDIKIKELEDYKKFWPEAFIVCVIPDKIGFYAQKIKNISSQGEIKNLEGKDVISLDIKQNFYSILQFKEFENINLLTLNQLKDMINKIGLFRTN